MIKEIRYGEILLPKDVHVAVGRECNLWWSTVANVEEDDRTVYFETKCDIGRNTKRSFTINANENQVGEHKLIIRCRDLRTRDILDEAETTVHVSPISKNQGQRSIVMFGDSRTWHNVTGEQGKPFEYGGNKATSTELKRLLDETEGARFMFVGSRVSEKDSSVRNIADNGWTYQVAVELLEKSGGLRSYLKNECGFDSDTLDYVTIMYGINDLEDWGANNLDQYEKSVAKIDGIIGYAKKLIDLINKDYPNCKIILNLECSTAGNQDGFAYWDGGATRADSQIETEFAVKALRKRVIAEFDCGKYGKNVIMSTAGLWCDRIYGYPYLIENRSERSVNTPHIRLINCVHPHDIGYSQISDGYFATIQYLERQ